MADSTTSIKKIVSLENLTQYDQKIKAKIADDDAAVLQAVNDLRAYVGEIPKTGDGDEAVSVASSVVAYVDLKTADVASGSLFDQLSDKVATLIGDKKIDGTDEPFDANKSVRAIANEELAAQLLSGDAEASFQTLQDLASWIENHPESVAAINGSIQSLQDKTMLGTYVEDEATKEYGSVKDYVEAVMGAEVNRADGAYVQQVPGKGLSENDLTNSLKQNYDAAYAHSQVPHAPVDAQVNVIENVTVNGEDLAVNDKTVDITMPTKLGDLTNDAGYVLRDELVFAESADIDTLFPSAQS